MHLSAYLKIIRPVNAAMSAGAVFLGAWIGGTGLGLIKISVLAVVAATCTGFGNVINDLFDIESDKISHPHRPLVQGTITRSQTVIYSLLLAISALTASFSISLLFGFGALAAIMVLTIYAFALKRTPLTGNIVVSVLVAYTLVYGALAAPYRSRLIIPALLAMLLNIAREIIKDLQDIHGDAATGINTTAALPHEFLRKLLLLLSVLYLSILFLPPILGHFGLFYTFIAAFVVLPVHLYRFFLLCRSDWERRLSKLSVLLKIEMMLGLSALACDKIFAD